MAAIAACVGTAGIASAESLCAVSAGIADADAVRGDTAVCSLRELEVRGSRVRGDVVSAAPMFSLSGERMRTMGVSDISDALHRLPGVSLRDYGGAGGMKTVSVRGLGVSHTGVVYDGIALSDCQSGHIDLQRYSLDNVADIGLVVGDDNDIFVPAKVAANAATIVINTAKTPTAGDTRLHAAAQMRFGSFGLYNPYINIRKSLNDRFSLSATGEFTHARNNYPFTLKNGTTQTREHRNNSMMNSGHAEADMSWRLTRRSTLDAKVYYYDNARELPGAVVLYNPTGHERLRERNFFGKIGYENRAVSKFAFKGFARFNWDVSRYVDVDGKYPGGELRENYYQREVYVSGSAMYEPTEKFAFNYSVDYLYNVLATNQTEVENPWRHTLLQTFAGRFKSGPVLVTARVLLSVYDNGAERGEAAEDRRKLSPSVGVSLQPIAEKLFFIRASYKNIFRMPTFNESYYFRMGSTSLKPESTDQAGLGMTWQCDTRGVMESVVLTGDVYYNRVRDKIVAIPQNLYLWSMTNLGRARGFGADMTAGVTLRVAAGQRLLFAGNYSWQRVQPRTDRRDADYNKQLAYTPVHSGSVSLSWENPWVDVVAHATGMSARYTSNMNLPVSRIAGYVDCGAALMRSFKLKRARIDLRIDMLNLFNTQYELVADYPMPGRAWKATILIGN